MLRFVIISSKKDSIKGFQDVIDKSMINYELMYEYYIFNNNDKKLEDYCKSNSATNVFIIEESSTINSLDVVHTIRNVCEMYVSFIIIIDNNKISFEQVKNKYSFLLDIVKHDENFNNHLKTDIEYIINIAFNRRRVLSFSNKGQVYRIPFSDIFYIEKEPNSKKCLIHCKFATYETYKSLAKISSMLDDSFIKTHQSAIVNKNNIKKVNNKKNSIIFSDKCECNLISRSNKKVIKELITK